MKGRLRKRSVFPSSPMNLLYVLCAHYKIAAFIIKLHLWSERAYDCYVGRIVTVESSEQTRGVVVDENNGEPLERERLDLRGW